MKLLFLLMLFYSLSLYGSLRDFVAAAALGSTTGGLAYVVFNKTEIMDTSNSLLLSGALGLSAFAYYLISSNSSGKYWQSFKNNLLPTQATSGSQNLLEYKAQLLNGAYAFSYQEKQQQDIENLIHALKSNDSDQATINRYEQKLISHKKAQLCFMLRLYSNKEIHETIESLKPYINGSNGVTADYLLRHHVDECTAQTSQELQDKVKDVVQTYNSVFQKILAYKQLCKKNDISPLRGEYDKFLTNLSTGIDDFFEEKHRATLDNRQGLTKIYLLTSKECDSIALNNVPYIVLHGTDTADYCLVISTHKGTLIINNLIIDKKHLADIDIMKTTLLTHGSTYNNYDHDDTMRYHDSEVELIKHGYGALVICARTILNSNVNQAFVNVSNIQCPEDCKNIVLQAFNTFVHQVLQGDNEHNTIQKANQYYQNLFISQSAETWQLDLNNVIKRNIDNITEWSEQTVKKINSFDTMCKKYEKYPTHEQLKKAFEEMLLNGGAAGDGYDAL